MVEGQARMPTPSRDVNAWLLEGYCVCCVRKRLGPSGDPAGEVFNVAQGLPGAVDGRCISCGHVRHSCLAARPC
jgi:hypothetical protein